MDFPLNHSDSRPTNHNGFVEDSFSHHPYDDHLLMNHDTSQNLNFQNDFGHISDYETPAFHIDEILLQEWFQPNPEYAPLVQPTLDCVVDLNERAPIYTTLISNPVVETAPNVGQLNSDLKKQEDMPCSVISSSDTLDTSGFDENALNQPKSIPILPNKKFREFVCSDCGQSFQSQRSLSNHKRSHLIRTTFTCVLCEKEFSVRRQLQIHLRVHKTPSTPKIASKKSKIQLVSDNLLTCKVCFKTFEDRLWLEQHMSLNHDGYNDPVVPQNYSEFINEEPTSAKDNQSDKPTERIKPNSNTKRVRCTHHDCSEVFENVQLLRRHQTIHRLKRFKCSGCQREYHSKPVFRSHVRLCQPPTDECVLVADDDIDSGPMDCRICGQLFENRRVLRFHRQFCSDATEELEESKRAQELRASLGFEPVTIKQEIEDTVDELAAE